MSETNVEAPSSVVSGDVRNRLHELGLSEKEVDMYLAVLRHGDATAKTLADEAGLSLRYVYEVADSLESRGILSLNDHETPTVIRAVPPSEAISNLVTRLRTVQDDLDSLYEEAGPPETEFDLLQSRGTVIRRAKSILENATEEVVLMTPSSMLQTLSDELAAARERGVLSFLVIPEEAASTRAPDRPFDELVNVVRKIPGEVPFMLAADVRAGLVSLAELSTGPQSGAGAVSVVQEQLVATMVGSFFGNYWSRGEELVVASPTSLPTTHEHFRHAVFDAVTSLNARDGVQAVVSRRNADGSDEVSGEVIHVRQSLVEPKTSGFPIENSLVLSVNGTRVTVGGEDSFVEDYEATEVVLEPIEK